MTSKTKKTKENNRYNWIVLGDTYFATSKMVLEELKQNYDHPQDQTGWGSDSTMKRLGFSDHGDALLIYPAVYNLKHGIEMYLKSFSVIEDGSVVTEHDLMTLFRRAKLCLVNKIGEKESKGFDVVWSNIKKYYFGTYIPSNVSEIYPDIHNWSERYPNEEDEKVRNSYALPMEEFEWVKKDLIDEIVDDIDGLHEVLYEWRRKLYS